MNSYASNTLSQLFLYWTGIQRFLIACSTYWIRFTWDISQVTWEDGTSFPKELIEEVRAACEASTQRIYWQTGDVVLINNHHFMHGRRPFRGERVIHTRFGNRRSAAPAE